MPPDSSSSSSNSRWRWWMLPSSGSSHLQQQQQHALAAAGTPQLQLSTTTRPPTSSNSMHPATPAHRLQQNHHQQNHQWSGSSVVPTAAATLRHVVMIARPQEAPHPHTAHHHQQQQQQQEHSTTTTSTSPAEGAAQQQQQQHRSLSAVLRGAGVRALGGGLPGAAAMVVQVLSLMWLRTTVQYQYRFGTSTRAALTSLYAQGGVPRFYRGLGPALLQAPLCRFGDTAANAGVLALLAEFEATSGLPLGLRTAAASATAACWRLLLLPLDALKTMSQVEGAGGPAALARKVRAGGPGVLYHGAAASMAAGFAGHFPWFATYNTLDERLPVPDSLHGRLLRSAGIGFCAGAASDAVSNSVRVIKTSRQTARTDTSYRDVVRSIVAQDGVSGLFTRGLTTRIAANGLQSICFTVLWRLGQDRLQSSALMGKLSSGGEADAAADRPAPTARERPKPA